MMDAAVPDHVRRYLREQAIDLALRTQAALRSPPAVPRHRQIVATSRGTTALQHVLAAQLRARLATR